MATNKFLKDDRVSIMATVVKDDGEDYYVVVADGCVSQLMLYTDRLTLVERPAPKTVTVTLPYEDAVALRKMSANDDDISYETWEALATVTEH